MQLELRVSAEWCLGSFWWLWLPLLEQPASWDDLRGYQNCACPWRLCRNRPFHLSVAFSSVFSLSLFFFPVIFDNFFGSCLLALLPPPEGALWIERVAAQLLQLLHLAQAACAAKEGLLRHRGRGWGGCGVSQARGEVRQLDERAGAS